MNYAIRMEEDTGWNGRTAAMPTPTEPDPRVRLDALSYTESLQDNSAMRFRRRIVLSIRIAFFVGIGLVIGMVLGFWFGGIWMGLLFVPAAMSAYGLFVSSGKQLTLMDRPIYGELPIDATLTKVS